MRTRKKKTGKLVGPKTKGVHPACMRGVRIETIETGESASLMLLYDAMTGQTRYGWQHERRQQRFLGYFTKVVDNLNRERKRGMRIRNRDFLHALFDYYQDRLVIGHLLTDYALNIYKRYMTRISVHTVSMTASDYMAYDGALLADLAQIREETPDQVTQLLQQCGLY